MKCPDIWPVGDRAPPCLPTHQYTHCLICTLRPLNTLPIQPNDNYNGSSMWDRQNIVFVYATRIVLHNVSGIAVNNLLVGYRRESFLGGQHRNAIPTPTALIVTGQQRCVDCESLICISPWTSTKDPRLQTLAICNLESAVRPRLIATLYSQYKPV